MPKKLGRYELVKKLATGGMGEVWLARHTGPVGFEKLVVLKTLLPHLKEDQEFVNMFFDEARIAAVLSHPHIAQIFDLGEDKGEYFIAMEYVPGVSLRDALVLGAETNRPMPLALKCRVIADAAAALDFAHQAKTPSGQPLDLIHRDVSPQNILIGFDGQVKLIDFGVAKAANKLVRTATGIIKGKYAYMSPEQAYGKPLDGRSDVFGLGIVFWEILCMTRLFKRESETDTLQAVVGADILPPSKYDGKNPKSLDALVLKALQRNLSERFQTGAEMKSAIEAFLQKQRLPASAAHLSAWMVDLYPAREIPVLPDESEEITNSDVAVVAEPTDSGESQPGATANHFLSQDELKQRIATVTASDVIAGTFFNALLVATMKLAGAASEPRVRRAAKDPKQYVDSLQYSSADFLRMLWKAVELASPKQHSVERTFELLGAEMMHALLSSPFGRSLKLLQTQGPEKLFGPLLATLAPMIRPGARALSHANERGALIVLKEEALPIQLYLGLLRALFQALFAKDIQFRFEKPAAERIELHLEWSP
jgi:eukaryotic-like serine/threonine-protein kinase